MKSEKEILERIEINRLVIKNLAEAVTISQFPMNEIREIQKMQGAIKALEWILEE